MVRLAQDLRVLFNMMQTISELYSLLDVGSAAGQQPALCCFTTATPCVFQLCKSLDWFVIVEQVCRLRA